MSTTRNSVPTIDKLKAMAKRHAKNTGIKLTEAKHQLAAMYGCPNWQTLKGVAVQATATRTFAETCKNTLLSSMSNLSFSQSPDSLKKLEDELNGAPHDYFVDMFLTVAYRVKIEGASSIREACEKAMEKQGDLSEMNVTGGDLPSGVISAIQQEEYPQEFAIEACDWNEKDRAYIPLAYVLDKNLLSSTFTTTVGDEADEAATIRPEGETRRLVFFYDEYETGELYLDPNKECDYGCSEGKTPISDELWGLIRSKGLSRALHVSFPRADRYGIPNCATDDGGRDYVKDFVMGIADDFVVYPKDMGTDNVEAHWLEIELPADLATRIEVETGPKENEAGWKMPLEEINFANFDGVEVAGCIDTGDGNMERVDLNEGDEIEPDIFSVYLHCKEGGTECIADFADIEKAEDYGKMVEQMLEKHGTLVHRTFTKEPKNTKDIYTLIVSHRFGENIDSFSTYEKAFDALYDYVCEEWSEVVDRFDVEPEDAPDDKEEAVRIYFEAYSEGASAHGPETWEIISGSVDLDED